MSIFFCELNLRNLLYVIALIQLLIASIAPLSVGVPALDIDLTMLYVGSRSLNALEAYTEP